MTGGHATAMCGHLGNNSRGPLTAPACADASSRCLHPQGGAGEHASASWLLSSTPCKPPPASLCPTVPCRSAARQQSMPGMSRSQHMPPRPQRQMHTLGVPGTTTCQLASSNATKICTKRLIGSLGFVISPRPWPEQVDPRPSPLAPAAASPSVFGIPSAAAPDTGSDCPQGSRAAIGPQGPPRLGRAPHRRRQGTSGAVLRPNHTVPRSPLPASPGDDGWVPPTLLIPPPMAASLAARHRRTGARSRT